MLQYLVHLSLEIAAIYCAGMYLTLAFRSFRFGHDYETETFHLCLCFILAVGFLGMGA